jgi:hypothetical protein
MTGWGGRERASTVNVARASSDRSIASVVALRGMRDLPGLQSTGWLAQ